MTSATPDRPANSSFRVRSYELDGLGHVNHAVYLNYLEQARYDTLAARGLPPEELERRGWAVHVVRVEVDYRRECRLGDRLLVRTWVEELRRSSMILRQELRRVRPPRAGDGGEREGDGDGDGEAGAETAVDARVVAVWIGPEGRPIRIPDEVRRALAGHTG